MSAQVALPPAESRVSPEAEVICISEGENEASRSLLEIRGDLDNNRVDSMLCVLSLSKNCLQSCISNDVDEELSDRIESFFEEEDGIADGVESEVADIVRARVLRKCSKAAGEECLRRQLVRNQEVYDTLILKRCLSSKKSVA